MNILILLGIFFCSILNLPQLRYNHAQISAKILLFLSGVKVESIQKYKKLNPTNAYYLGNFLGIEILPALISVINEPTSLILRWFNFYTPIFGWAFTLLKFIPFSGNFSKFQRILNARLIYEGYSVINFPAGYSILHRDDSSELFKPVVFHSLKEKVKVIPFAVVENEIRNSLWFRSRYTISFLEEETFDPMYSKKKQIHKIEKEIRTELLNLNEGV
ncbi:lysophospholipid acyltransferase family protein [Leptospira kanakyensis]|uniref:hypothetical protein n=1 Tax=Leptospira kanakyensis TaxID=2484968 RepID=UPI00223D767C|nr:hypothetical protein [Leptospira kanakyensis]MCW7470560.1 hypothetical protein [Leptospira kanakyensis]